MKQLVLTIIWLGCFVGFLQAQLTLKVTDIPKNSASSIQLFVAGTFNNWEPGDTNSKMSKDAKGHYTLTINPPKGEVRYKFTRGNWATVEGSADGSFRPDRVIQYDGGKRTVFCNINNWEGSSAGQKKSTAAANVIILDKSFRMPELKRSRRVWIYLPPDYYNSNKSYPVIYLHDGQNIFDNASAFSGEWKVDETLNEIFQKTQRGFIAVGIDNGAQYRFDEYSAWRNTRFGGGDGDKYVQFIAESLKPYIDENFRTLSDRNNTAIIGSSMGGLISHYAIMERPDVFGKAGVFSPSFWFTNQVFWYTSSKGKQQDVKIFMIGGLTEKSNMVGNMYAMKRTMLARGFDNSEIYLDVHGDGQHSEWYWAREMPDAINWLFPNNGSRSLGATNPEEKDFPIELSSADGRTYKLECAKMLSKKMKFEVFDEEGTLIQKAKKVKLSQNDTSGAKGALKLPKLGEGTFYIHLLDDIKLMMVKEVE